MIAIDHLMNNRAGPAPLPERSTGLQPLRDRALVLALEILDHVLIRAEELQRWLAHGAWGPAHTEVDIAHAAAACLASLDALETLGPDAVAGRARQLRQHGIGAASVRFRGWHRADRRRPWVAIVEGFEGQPQEDVLDELLDRAPPGGDKVVLSSDQDPNQQRKPR
jgi:hypothetical protein